MYGQDMLQAFDFEDQHSFDDEVEPIPAIELDAFVFHGKRHLSFEFNSAQVKFVAEAFFVGRFEKSRAERSVDLNRGTDHTLSKFFMK